MLKRFLNPVPRTSGCLNFRGSSIACNPWWPEFLILFVVKGLQALLLGAAAYYCLIYIAMASVRVPYPYQLEWLESGVAHEVQRVLEGLPLYTAPSLEYIPFLYTPLYFYVGAGMTAIMGPGFLPLRLLSFLASLGCFLVIYLFVRRETGSRFAGGVGMGLYAASFRISGAWFDTARVDSLLLLFLLSAIYVVAFCPSKRAALLTGLLLSAAFLTKQSCFLVIAPVLFYLLLFNWRRAMIAGGVTALLLLSSTLYLNIKNNGWYWRYFAEHTTKSGFVQEKWLGFWVDDLLAPMPFALLLALLCHFLYLSEHRPWRGIFFLGVTSGMFLMSWLSRVHVGGYDNVLMPAFAWIAILAPIAASRLHKIAQSASVPQPGIVLAGLCFAFLLQFALLLYNPLAQLPSWEDRSAGDQLMVKIAATQGEVFIPYHNFLPAMVGKRVYASRAGIRGVMLDRQMPGRQELIDEITHAFESRKFSLIIMDDSRYFREVLEKQYIPRRISYPSPTTGYAVTGMRTRPTVIWEPRPHPADAEHSDE